MRLEFLISYYCICKTFLASLSSSNLIVHFQISSKKKVSPHPSMSASVSCPHHPGAVLIEDHRAGDQICSECGLVVWDRVIDVGSEWRTFSSEVQLLFVLLLLLIILVTITGWGRRQVPSWCRRELPAGRERPVHHDRSQHWTSQLRWIGKRSLQQQKVCR